MEIRSCKSIALKIANSHANVLITGETGTGKELFAQAIHNASERRQNPFIAVNCGAIVESLLESELFGYEKGAFTGAKKEGKPGLFELAHRGTLFLDEIGDMPLGLQVKLLRALQEKEIVRVGGNEAIPVDVRIIAATNRDLFQSVKENTFRADLFYRINALFLSIPPLRQRKADIKTLIEVFMRRGCCSFLISPRAMERILRYSFPGNIRELQNCVDYMESLGLTCIEEQDLPPYILRETGRPEEQPDVTAARPQPHLESEEDLDAILLTVAEINNLGVGAGRRSIHTVLANRGKNRSERKLRSQISALCACGLIKSYPGRRGIELTPQGRDYLEHRNE